MRKVHWIQHTHLFKKDEYECSACHAVYTKAYEVCPNCGAKMGRSKYDPSWVDEMEAFDAILGDD